MPACSAYGCTNRPSTKSKKQRALEASGLKITFHRLPKNPALNKLWVEAIRRKDWVPSNGSVLCSMHFNEADFDRTSLSVVRLRENAVPSVFNSFPSYLQVTKSESQKNSPSKRKPEAVSVASSSCVISPVIEINQSVASELPILKTVTRSTSVSPESKRRRCVSPTKKVVRQSFKIREQKYANKIKSLQRSKIRRKKTITDLKKILLELKSSNLSCLHDITYIEKGECSSN